MDGTVPSNKELVDGTVPSNNELVEELFRPIATSFIYFIEVLSVLVSYRRHDTFREYPYGPS